MINTDWSTVGIIITILSAVASLTWWLSGQFSGVRHLVHERVEKVETTLLNKLEYHERHDDSRFAGIRGDLLDIRIRNAAKDGLVSPILRNKE